jgi:N-acetylmuramoyl-L-alanine amidase-like protein
MARRLLLAVTLALAFPAVSSAGLASLEARDVALGSARTLSATHPAKPFQLVGIHWRGSGRVELRTRSAGGAWSGWQPVVEDEDGPDPGGAEQRAGNGWRVSAPVWVGTAVGLEVRTFGRVTRARVLTVRSPVSKVPFRATASAGMPRVVARSAWLADEAIVKGKPAYADVLRMAHVHHTAGTNTYTRLQAPAVVRAIQLYHVKGNGWNDIGYNALVDRFGTVYEGRAGGLDRNVVGAHARGFNTGSFGIAVMGDFRTVDPPAVAVDALVETLAWRLDLAHVDPLSTFNGVSSGNERFKPGIPVFLRAISGHRDTGLTTCPGERLYARLGEIARRVAALGLPKLYAPTVATDESGGFRFRGRVSSALPWSVVVTDPAGLQLARGTGTGATVDWTWRPLVPVLAGTRWRMETPGATRAEGTIGTTATPTTTTLQLSAVTAAPATITPNGDGQADTTTIAFTPTVDANITVAVVDLAGATVAELENRRWRRAGARSVTFDGADLPDGTYLVRVTAQATGGREAVAEIPVRISRAIGTVTLSSPFLTPNADGVTDTVSVVVPLTSPSLVSIWVKRDGRLVATLFSGNVGPGEQTASWDGLKRLGRALDGTYNVSVEATDALGAAVVDVPLVVDTKAPAVRIVSDAPPRLQVSEAATLDLMANGARRRIRVDAAGVVRIPRIERLRTLTGTATDAAGNRTVLGR